MPDLKPTPTTVPFDQLSAMPELVICALDDWSLTRITGEERYSYLNGQVTCDVSALAAGQSVLGAHCDAKGKMWAAFRLFALEEQLLLAQKCSTEALQVSALKKFAVFSNVEIEVDDGLTLYGIAGEQAAQWVTQHYGVEAAAADSILVEGGMLVRIKVPQVRYLLVTTERLTENAPASVWQALDIAAGIPQLEQATQLQFIPQMLNLQLLDAISFTKGCYMGQETVARAKYRGSNKRATFSLSGKGERRPEAGDNLELQLDNGTWRNAGTVLQRVQYQDGHIEMLAVLPNDIAADGLLRLKSDPSSRYQLATQAYALNI